MIDLRICPDCLSEGEMKLTADLKADGTADLESEEIVCESCHTWWWDKGHLESAWEERLDNDTAKLRDQWEDVREAIVGHYGEDDACALDQGFNDWIDSLCKDGVISCDNLGQHITREDVER